MAKSKKKWTKYLLIIVAVFALLLLAKFGLFNGTDEESTKEATGESVATESESETRTVKKNGTYTSKEDVALYIYTYGCLPSNFITKDEAEDLGWSGGDLWQCADGKSIGGDYFGNYEGLLPKKSGRKYYECDIDYNGGSRSGKRIIYSNDGLIYYTSDHYESFTLMYGEP